MKITIAGANSFIGKRILALAEYQNDVDITAVVRKNDRLNFSQFTKVTNVIECDMENYAQLGTLAGKGDCFIDLPWKGSRGVDRQNSELQEYNYKYNMAAMQSMADAGYTTLVSAGSQAEYGQCTSFISEDTALNPNTEYGKYKVQIFNEATELCDQYGIRFIEPRYFSLYGPGDYEKTLIMSCIYKMLNDEKCELNECTQVWDYLYVDDAVEALFSLIKSSNATGAYNFASGEYRMIREFVMDIHSALNSASHVQFGSPQNTFNGLIINLKPVVDKLKRDAAWTPRTPFRAGIERIAKSIKG